MNRDGLSDLIRSRESSGVEFKRDDVRPDLIEEDDRFIVRLWKEYARAIQ